MSECNHLWIEGVCIRVGCEALKYVTLKAENKQRRTTMSDCFGDCEQRELKNKILKLEAENERLREALDTELAPDYERFKRAKKLADAEYVGQAWRPLWEWAWKQAALEENSDER